MAGVEVYPEEVLQLETSAQDRAQQESTDGGETKLSLIYSSIQQLQEEVRNESRTTHVDNKKLHGAIRRVNKSYMEKGARISAAEDRTDNLERDQVSFQGQTDEQQSQMSDFMWKVRV
ncbi:hypothetical protein NDU88_003559 [Pleurodeles waltl]|uniref:Uncharacterized protein n=1 Tax=Pleurodeles waltl TaxID=8319 RepID=A0AAV7T6H4_PLEWA|nr:hypothetical protein NDU88_003559 [Pleurodeles waltl]